jgi:hypothetical protein
MILRDDPRQEKGSTGAAVMGNNSAATQRIHSEAPAEGDELADPTDLRMHSQEPAEGADIEPEAGT